MRKNTDLQTAADRSFYKPTMTKHKKATENNTKFASHVDQEVTKNRKGYLVKLESFSVFLAATSISLQRSDFPAFVIVTHTFSLPLLSLWKLIQLEGGYFAEFYGLMTRCTC